MTAAISELSFADITVGRAWYRIDDVHDLDTQARYRVPFLHYSLDCQFPNRTGRQLVTRGGADIVEAQPFFDTCDRWGASDCPDAPGHARPVSVCPWCAPALTGRAVA